MAAKKDDLPILAFVHAEAWHTWLTKEHARSRGVWMKLAKAKTGIASVDYAGALDVALAWGWIDGQKASHDERHWLQKFCPRGPRSIWSKVNREKIAVLEAAGKLQPSGRAAVDAAKKDGRWDRAYDSPSRVTVPDDLAAALAKNAKAKKLFAELDSANRYAILHRVHTAVKPETRANRIATFVEMLAKGETLHPRKRARAKKG